MGRPSCCQLLTQIKEGVVMDGARSRSRLLGDFVAVGVELALPLEFICLSSCVHSL